MFWVRVQLGTFAASYTSVSSLTFPVDLLTNTKEQRKTSPKQNTVIHPAVSFEGLKNRVNIFCLETVFSTLFEHVLIISLAVKLALMWDYQRVFCLLCNTKPKYCSNTITI